MGVLGIIRTFGNWTLLACVGLWFCSVPGYAQLPLRVGVQWRANTEPDLAGYHIYYGPTNRVYTNRVTVGKLATTAWIESLVPGARYHLAITAFVIDGTESLPSSELVYQAPGLKTNTPPYITPIADQATPEDTPTGSVPFAVFDDETSAEALVVTARSSNPRLVPDPYILLGGSGIDRGLMIVPQLDQSGLTEITVEVRDSDGATSSVTFALVVLAMNDNPVMSPIGNQTINEDSASGRLPFYVFDAEQHPDHLWLVALSSNPLVLPAENIILTGTGNSRALSFTPAKDAFGTSHIEVYAVDSEGGYVATDFNVVVRPVNDPPTVVPPKNVVINEDAIGSLLHLNVADVDNPPADLLVAASSSNPLLIAPESIVLGGAAGQRSVLITPRPNQFGSSIIGVLVQDADGAASSNSFSITVNSVNDAPTLDPISDFSLHEGAGPVTVPLSGISSGAGNEAQSLSVTAVSDQPGIILNPQIQYASPNANGLLIVAPLPDTNGAATITVTVNDGGATNASVTRSFKVAVQAFNNPPIIYSLPGLAVAQLPLSLRINFTVQDPDTAADRLVLTGYSSDPGVLPSENLVFTGTGMNRTLTVNPIGRTGLVTVTVTVSDGDATFSTSFYVLITAAGA